ncbi:hypothetical protein V2J09_011757 [Rumex salicifolius]
MGGTSEGSGHIHGGSSLAVSAGLAVPAGTTIPAVAVPTAATTIRDATTVRDAAEFYSHSGHSSSSTVVGVMLLNIYHGHLRRIFKLEWWWICKLSPDRKKTTTEVLDFLMDANIQLNKSEDQTRNLVLA